jgi:hypothetical protein
VTRTRNVEENQQAIADENGIPPLINLLESPFAKLQLNAAATLWNLSVNGTKSKHEPAYYAHVSFSSHVLCLFTISTFTHTQTRTSAKSQKKAPSDR